EVRDAVDPTAAPEEQLLAIWSVTERLHRLEGGPKIIPEAAAAPPLDNRVLPSARLSKGFQLILRETYPNVLLEALQLLQEKHIQFPPFLLPDLLTKAVSLQDEDPAHSQLLVRAAGTRGQWLIGLNPAWATLSDHFDYPTAFSREATPGRRSLLLKRWRRQAPNAAREALGAIWDDQSPKNQELLLEAMAVNPVPEDVPWLRARMGPKRRGVRRTLFRLLLLGGEAQATDEATTLAASSLTDAGKIGILLTDEPAKDLLNAYGGLQKKETLEVFLLDVAPPQLLPDLVGQTGPEFWAGLRKEALLRVAQTLLRYPNSDWRTAFVRFACQVNPAQLPLAEAAKITTSLSQEAFLTVFHELLDVEKEVLHFGGVPRILALSRAEPWSERITKAFVLQLVKTLREVGSVPYTLQRDLQAHWKLAIPLFHISTFGWLRTQLHAMTERADVFGKLATEALQTTAFRRALREG
ncbi:MAG: DUF5691 domain-containing protein, partial [Bacteroidota bacterium]